MLDSVFVCTYVYVDDEVDRTQFLLVWAHSQPLLFNQITQALKWAVFHDGMHHV